jgi:hypothetical protein
MSHNRRLTSSLHDLVSSPWLSSVYDLLVIVLIVNVVSLIVEFS